MPFLTDVIVGLLFAVIFTQQILHVIERKRFLDMLNSMSEKLMSRDFREYKTLTKPKVNAKPKQETEFDEYRRNLVDDTGMM